MLLSELSARALRVRQLYDAQAVRRGGRPWTAAEFAQGFAGDVGDLMKLTMAKQGLRPAENLEARLAHELADCLWSVLVLADAHGIDLEASFLRTMDELEQRIAAEA
ncbi:MAG TPA: MazG nucleotide pyrophosphohydrolase domain-containing protein [Opitutaceae bacterium]|nr:MazG nucleotide pyrophosphohydrolase domain-containing protein [Opitutaceae bacterium]HRJ46714.1 MazG nucleotide pyrophosphohydrolase domain-containing protein [Opitutaceae bacterium]